MTPKYVAGTKVRIRSHDFLSRISDPGIEVYENMTGEILDSMSIVAFIRNPWAKIGDRGELITVYHYTVKINEQTIVHDISEECLEIIG